MKQTLQLKLSQQLTLTPQLQQSIRLLQLSTLELNQELESFLMENPLLERDDAEPESSPPPPMAPGARNTSRPPPRRRPTIRPRRTPPTSTGLPMHRPRPPGATTAKIRSTRNWRPAPPPWGNT